MERQKSLFILGGNGSYNNRGCEAIVRGTIEVISKYYDNPYFLCNTQYSREELFEDGQFERQCQVDAGKSIIHKKTITCKNIFDYEWAINRAIRKILPYTDIYDYIYKEMTPYLSSCKAALSVGGDNYAIDFGLPKMVLKLDDIVLKNHKPLIIWGASIGPFSRIPKYERYMANHLRKVTGIFARESFTIDYLDSIGVRDNVYKVSDPAFLMSPIEPKESVKPDIKGGAIGLNLSPLMAKYVTKGDVDEWKKIAAEIVTSISKHTSRTIYLIPHVTTPNTDDYIFMKELLSNIKEPEKKIILIPPIYNASETKWIISKMHIFAGSRTHSTIAALSSKVPTISFAYSMKAAGINKDIFGNTEYCLDPENMTPQQVTQKIEATLDNFSQIKNKLERNIPEVEENALLAGKHLYEIIE